MGFKLKYRILQADIEEPYKFMDMDFIEEQKLKINLDKYKEVYNDIIKIVGNEGFDDVDVLEKIFSTCNKKKKPDGFIGHSMSVSDIIVIIDNKKNIETYYYCDIFEFKLFHYKKLEEK